MPAHARGSLASLVLLTLVAACGGNGGSTSSSPPPPPPPPPPGGNAAPTATINASPLIVPRNDGNTTVVTLDGSGSTDPDNDPLTYAWTAASGTFVGNTTPSDIQAQVTFPGLAPYLVTLTVNDGQGHSNMASVTIAVGP